MDFTHYLTEQLQNHPSNQPQDIVKQCYQAACGAEHLLSDLNRARNYLDHEFQSIPASSHTPLYEAISDHVCRANLAAWKHRGLPVEWLFRMFAASASATSQPVQTTQTTLDNPYSQNPQAKFLEYLGTAETMILQGQLPVPFSAEEWHTYLAAYKKNGMTAVHHSEAYRQAERPAYRILQKQYIRLIPILEAAAKYIADISPTATGSLSAAESSAGEPAFKRPCIIAIDGRAASGKTTMARQLADILGGDIIQMDDFFLPPALRTEERFRTPGGNVHYERFREEVLPHLSQSEPFSYERFDCHIMDYHGQRHVSSKSFRIVEGSCSCHPQLGDYADITVFSTVAPDVQMQRILRRNGAEMAEVFRERWIPMEELYIRECGIGTDRFSWIVL